MHDWRTGPAAVLQFSVEILSPRQAVRRFAESVGYKPGLCPSYRWSAGRQYRSEQRLCCSAWLAQRRVMCEQHPRDLSTWACVQAQQQRFALTGSSVPCQVASPDLWGSSEAPPTLGAGCQHDPSHPAGSHFCCLCTTCCLVSLHRSVASGQAVHLCWLWQGLAVTKQQLVARIHCCRYRYQTKTLEHAAATGNIKQPAQQ